MASITSWSYDRIQLYLQLDGGPSIPIVRAQIDFELNAIPRALVYLPVGRDSATGQPSPVHQVTSAFETQTPAKLICSISPRFASGKVKDFGFPAGAFTLFDGFTVGLGQSKSRGGMQYYLALQHWLGQLNFSSTVSASSFPVNPRKYTFGLMLPNQNNSGAKDYVGPYDPANALTPSNINSDIWSQALQPYLIGLAGAKGLQVLEGIGATETTANDGALTALKRMSSLTLPLTMRLQPDTNFAEVIRNDIWRLSADPETLAHHTFWDVVVGLYAADYLFAIVPQISTAQVIPYVPAVRTPYITVSADEYVAIDRSRALIRPLRAVGLLSSLDSTTGADGQPDAAPADKDMGVGGWYSPKDVKNGMVLLTSGPRWSQQLVAVRNYAANAAGGKQNPINIVDAPDAAGAPNAQLKDGAKAVARSTIKPILNQLAQTRYIHEVTKQQQGTISGPLRIDIAPGSCIQVEGSNETTIADDAAGLDFFGTVLRTSLVIDAEDKTAGTAFHLAHLRSVDENKSDAGSLASHPLYTATFYGAGLTGDPVGNRVLR